jgi:hypothetical protein
MQAKYKFALALATGFCLGAGAIHGLQMAVAVLALPETTTADGGKSLPVP